MLRSVLAAAGRRPWESLAGVTAFATITGFLVWLFLVWREPWQWMVDMEVYREAGISVLIGRPLYGHLTDAPQLLPFTYTPLAALLFVPLALVPFTVAGWAWTVMQLVLLAGIVAVAWDRLLDRFGRWRALGIGVVAGCLWWVIPFKDGLMLGQIDVVLVALCLADHAARSPRWPRGALIGLAMAIKLTPGVFLLHLLFARRWREAATAAATAAALTVAAAVVLPYDSWDFWTHAIFTSDRLGDNTSTLNQSLRAVLLRAGVEGALPWLALALLVGAYGFWHAVRCTRAGQHLAACAVVGLLAVLLSPVAWIHHLAWLVLVLAVLVGDGRNPRRVLLVLGLALVFTALRPDVGSTLMGLVRTHGWWPLAPVGRLVENSYVLLALVLIPLTSRYALEDAGHDLSEETERSVASSAADRPTVPVG